MTKKIGISMRVQKQVYPSGTSEARDCLSQDFANFMKKALPNVAWLPLPNVGKDIVKLVQEFEINGFILSGGNDIGENLLRDESENALLEYAKEKYLPCLGICRGMQMMNVFCGGSLEAISEHTATRHKIILPTQADKELEVNSYHNFALYENNLATDFGVLAYHKDKDNKKSIEAIKHKSLPWLGLMWHSERDEILSAYDKKLIEELFS